jgi:diguanylate cyclase (GGDEF)-like protein/PAS domain S-box-containing protein
LSVLPWSRNSNQDGGDGDPRFRALVQHSSEMISIFDKDGKLQYLSPSVARVLGFQADELRRSKPWSLAHPGDLARITRYVSQAGASQEPAEPIVIRMQHRDGNWRYIEAIATNLLNEPGVNGIMVTARDITSRKNEEEYLVRQAWYDVITGLANRALFMDRLHEALHAAEGRAEGVAVLFLDLDGFKVVNDSLGHAAGDALLAAVGQRIATSVRPGDTVARFGGDEFTILVERPGHPSVALGTAERVIRAIRPSFVLDGQEVYVGASVGISLCIPVTASTRAEDLVREADTALYAAKAAGKGRAVMYNSGMNTKMVRRLTMESELRRAVDRGELVLHYQPEINLTNGEICGVEALVRWDHPTRGLINPSDFIPFAEETDLILPIGRWVLEEACAQWRHWQGTRGDGVPLTMAVNLSARQFQHPGLVDEIVRAVEKTGMDPFQLKLEITESTLMQTNSATQRSLDELRKLGVQFALDDFGTGYSSLSYLQVFKADTLKVDRSFLSGVERGGDALAIVRSITSLAHALGMGVTVEGVETAEQLLKVRAVQCDQAQGFYFSEPRPGEDVSRMLRSGAPILYRAS